MSLFNHIHCKRQLTENGRIICAVTQIFVAGDDLMVYGVKLKMRHFIQRNSPSV